MEIMGNILDFSVEDKETVGLGVTPQSWLPGWSSLPPLSLSYFRSRESPDSPSEIGSNQSVAERASKSFGELWVDFLLNEAEKDATREENSLTRHASLATASGT